MHADSNSFRLVPYQEHANDFATEALIATKDGGLSSHGATMGVPSGTLLTTSYFGWVVRLNSTHAPPEDG